MRLFSEEGIVKIRLSKPVVFGDETIEELELREPCAGDLRGMDLDNITADGMLAIISRCSARPSAVIDKLSIPDFKKASEAVGVFFGGGQETEKSG